MWPRPSTATLGGSAGERRNKDVQFVSATLGKLDEDGRRAKSLPWPSSHGNSTPTRVGDATLGWQCQQEMVSPASLTPTPMMTKYCGNADGCGSVGPVPMLQHQLNVEHTIDEEEKRPDKERSVPLLSMSRATTATPGYDTPRRGSPLAIFQRHAEPDSFGQAESHVAGESHGDAECGNRARGSQRESATVQPAEALPSLNAAKLTALDSRTFASLNVERWRQAFREESQACIQAMQRVVSESKLADVTATFAEWRRADRAELEQLRSHVVELLRLNASLRQNQLDWLTRDEFSKLKQLLTKSVVPIMETSQALKGITVALEAEANSVAELRLQLAESRSQRIADDRNWERLMRRIESLQDGIAELEVGKMFHSFKNDNLRRASTLPPGLPECPDSLSGDERGEVRKDNFEYSPEEKATNVMDSLLLLQRVKTIESRGRVELGSLDGLVKVIQPIEFEQQTRDLAVHKEAENEDNTLNQERHTIALAHPWAAQEVLRDALELAQTMDSGLVIEGVYVDVCDDSSHVQAERKADLIKKQLLQLGADPCSLRCCEPCQMSAKQANDAQVVLKVNIFPCSES